MNQFGRVAA